MEKVIEGKRCLYHVPVKGKKVKHFYINKARRRFRLLPEDGVSHEEFNRA